MMAYEKLEEFTERCLRSVVEIATSSASPIERWETLSGFCEDIVSIIVGSVPQLENPTPIEEKLAQAISKTHFASVSWKSWKKASEALDWLSDYERGCGCGIAHQVEVPRGNGKHYRVDFLMAAKSLSDSLPGVLVAVECDGHDFHERTKEQAAFDRSRERELMRKGITVIRFTGSEIWSDADRCAREAIEILFQRQCETIERPDYTEAANG